MGKTLPGLAGASSARGDWACIDSPSRALGPGRLDDDVSDAHVFREGEQRRRARVRDRSGSEEPSLPGECFEPVVDDAILRNATP